MHIAKVQQYFAPGTAPTELADRSFFSLRCRAGIKFDARLPRASSSFARLSNSTDAARPFSVGNARHAPEISWTGFSVGCCSPPSPDAPQRLSRKMTKPGAARAEIQRNNGSSAFLFVSVGKFVFARNRVPKLRRLAGDAERAVRRNGIGHATGDEINFRAVSGAMNVIESVEGLGFRVERNSQSSCTPSASRTSRAVLPAMTGHRQLLPLHNSAPSSRCPRHRQDNLERFAFHRLRADDVAPAATMPFNFQHRQ